MTAAAKPYTCKEVHLGRGRRNSFSSGLQELDLQPPSIWLRLRGCVWAFADVPSPAMKRLDILV
jgi:hypothetical protein